MTLFGQILAVAIVSVAAILILKKTGGDFAMVVSLVSVCVLCVFALTMLQPVMDMLERLQSLSGLNTAVMAPVFKTALVGILTGVAATICTDSGQNGIAKMVELCGTVMALYLASPLISAVLDLLNRLVGG